MGLIGSTPELGKWKTPLKMQWHQGHNWKLSEPLRPTKSCFTYKFVVVGENGKIAQWESGVDRVADLHKISGEDEKTIISYWGQFLVKFSIYTPETPNEQLYLLQNGWHHQMSRTKRPWLPSKYGDEIEPWECQLMMNNQDGRVLGEKRVDIDYFYQRHLNGKIT
jgi:hypothetical protein